MHNTQEEEMLELTKAVRNKSGWNEWIRHQCRGWAAGAAPDCPITRWTMLPYLGVIIPTKQEKFEVPTQYTSQGVYLRRKNYGACISQDMSIWARFIPSPFLFGRKLRESDSSKDVSKSRIRNHARRGEIVLSNEGPILLSNANCGFGSRCAISRIT